MSALCKRCEKNTAGPVTWADPKGDLCFACVQEKNMETANAHMVIWLKLVPNTLLAKEFYERKLHLIGAGGA